MSNGSMRAPSPWAEVSFDTASLTGVVAAETEAVEFAQGDLKGAKDLLVDEVKRAQKKVEAAQAKLAERQQAAAESLREKGIIGRAIDITRATSLAQPGEGETGRNLASFSGVIQDVEVGTLLGNPLETTDAIVLHVEDSKGGEGVHYSSHAFIAGDAEFTIHPAPQPDQPAS